jgi:hypothetical protein
MNSTKLINGILAAGLLAASPVFAGPYDGQPDMEHGILNDLGKTTYVGTANAVENRRIDPFHGALAGNPDIDQSGFTVGTAGPEKGEADLYGSVLYDVGALR